MRDDSRIIGICPKGRGDTMFRLRVFLMLLAASLMHSTGQASPDTAEWCTAKRADGIEIDGSRIISIYRLPVLGDSKSAVKTASTIAQERAKANIAKFIREVQTTTTTTSTSSVAKMVNGTLTEEQVQVLQEMSTSSAAETLLGVVKVEDAYRGGEVCVAMGLSPNSAARAAKVKDLVSGAPSRSLEDNGSTTVAKDGREPAEAENSYQRTRKNDW